MQGAGVFESASALLTPGKKNLYRLSTEDNIKFEEPGKQFTPNQ